jgi:hypothetical protein
VASKGGKVMTKDDYNEYVGSVRHFFEREGIENLTTIQVPEVDEGSEDEWEGSPPEPYTENDWSGEPFFSWHPCECCQRSQGGNRYTCEGYNRKLREVVGPFDVCEDCIYYSEYGRLDDQTMDEIEKS